MGFTLDYFCFFISLRIGCMIIGVVGAISGVINVIVYQEIPSYIGIALAVVGSVSLIFAAVNTNGSTKTRIIAVLVYMGTCILQVLLKIIGLILTCITWSNTSRNHEYFALVVVELVVGIVLDIYFLVVAFSFYKELK